MKIIFLCLISLLAIQTTTGITGTWNVVSSSASNITRVEFKNNGAYNCYMGNAMILSGVYTFDETDSTLIIEDDGCLDITGKYKVQLFNNADSIRFTPISDDCLGRKASVQSALLSRVKD